LNCSQASSRQTSCSLPYFFTSSKSFWLSLSLSLSLCLSLSHTHTHTHIHIHTQALLAFSLPPAAAAAHVAALHRLTSAAIRDGGCQPDNGSNAHDDVQPSAAEVAGEPGTSQGAKGGGVGNSKGGGRKGGKGRGKGAAGAPGHWCMLVLEAAHEVLVKAVERRGVVRGGVHALLV